MKSLFSCIPRKKSKSKKNALQEQRDHLISNNKHIEINNSNVQCHDETVGKPEDNIEKPIEEKEVNVNENDEVVSQNSQEEIAFYNALVLRLNNALLRIENASNVLNKKYSCSYLVQVLVLFENLCKKELNDFIFESEKLDFSFNKQSQLIRQLFCYHNSILLMIHTQAFGNLPKIIDGFRKVVIEINEVCLEDDFYKELHRLIADSILLLGWVCVLESPSKFLTNNLDGFLINITRLLNDSRFVKHCNWIKCWAVVLKSFALIVTTHFQASLMWRLEGPIPMDILRCLIECNYSKFEDNVRKIGLKCKEKVIKTTAVDDVSHETMTSLMEDLRSGRHKAKLRPVKPITEGKPETYSYGSADVEHQKEMNDIEIKEMEPNGLMHTLDYQANKNSWLLENVRDQSDIEIPNKGPKSFVQMKACHNCSVQINGTVDSITFDQCSAINVIIDDVTRIFEIFDCSNIESQVFGSIGKVDMKNVSELRLFVPLQSLNTMEISLFKTSDIDLFVSKHEDGGLELDDYDKFPIKTNCRNKISGGKVTCELF